MNDIEAIVNVYDNHITFTYLYRDKPYTIEVPKTEKNAELVDGQKILVFIAIDRME